MKVFVFFGIWMVLLCAAPYAQNENNPPDGVWTLQSVHAGEAPVIDGILDYTCWNTADWQGDFIQLRPSPTGNTAENMVSLSFIKEWRDESFSGDHRCSEKEITSNWNHAWMSSNKKWGMARSTTLWRSPRYLNQFFVTLYDAYRSTRIYL